MGSPTRKLNLQDFIRDVPDFPKQGIIFKDITPLLNHKDAIKRVVNLLAARFREKKVQHIVAVESRGFIFGAALAYKLGCGFVPVRKRGKLPYKTKQVTYELEYGTDTLEIHEDAIARGDRVLIVDDLLATGGTVKAVTELVKIFSGKIVGIAFLIELTFLKGRDKLKEFPLHSIIKY